METQRLDGSQLRLPFDMSLRLALAEEFEAALGQVDDLALIVFFEVVIRFDLPVGDLFDHAHDLVRLPNQPNQSLIFRFKQLEEGPDRDVLERSIAAR